MPGHRGLILAIETSNPAAPGLGAGSVALGERREAGIGLRGALALSAESRHDEALMPAIDTLFRRIGARPSDLDRVVVSLGPGGFTGLRVAVATAMLLCESTGAGAVGVASTTVAFAKVKGREGRREGSREARRVAVALAGKGETAWITIFEPGASTDADAPGELLDAAGMERVHAARPIDLLLADEHAPRAMREWAAASGVRVRAPWLSATRCLAVGAHRATIDPALLAPIYPREPEAVTKWRSRRAGG